jgi:hypothetical protein
MMGAASLEGFRHELIPLTDRDRWNAALQAVPHAIGHTWAYCHAFWLSSRLPTWLYHGRVGRAHVVCPLSERSFRGEWDVFTPYGFAGMTSTETIPSFEQEWRRFVDSRLWVCAYLQGNPLLHDPLAGKGGVTYNSIFVLDLTRPDEELLAGMSASRRRGLRRLREQEFDIEPGGLKSAEFVIRHAQEFFAEKSASSRYRFADETWRELLAAPGILVLEARQGGQLVAITMFGIAGGLADYLFNISIPSGQAASAGLLWAGMRKLRASGCRTLNLGGGIRPDDNVAEFKRRFGGKSVPLVSFKQIFRPEAFAMLCRVACVSPVTDGFFPPYHARSGTD